MSLLDELVENERVASDPFVLSFSTSKSIDFSTTQKRAILRSKMTKKHKVADRRPKALCE